jgi:glycosyltransferase involved in cell wall biosynthesis
MYRNLSIAVVVPCYNEEKLLERTVGGLPDFIDHIIVVNDASTDKTLEVMHKLVKKVKKIHIINNEVNGGIGFSLKSGFQYAIQSTDAVAIGIVSGDAQCDPSCIKPMLDEFIDKNCDYIKGNRFFKRDALASMPTFRRLGNVFISLLTKFSTGYYSISDTTMGFGFLRRSALEQVDYKLVKNRYDYENSMLIALSIVRARIKDFPVPAIYGEETSTIDVLPTIMRVLRVIWVGFWQRIYYKYILFSLHPIVIFLFGGLVLSLVGWIYALYLVIERIINNTSPTSGTVMLAVLPIILGFQMLMTAILMDISDEDRP